MEVGSGTKTKKSKNSMSGGGINVVPLGALNFQ